MSNYAVLIKDLMGISCLILLGSAHAQSQPSPEARAFADRMVTCDSHALMLHMYARGQVPTSVPQRAEYRDIAYAAAGRHYVAERLISEDEMNKALQELEPLLNAKSIEGLTEEQKDEHTYAVWSRVIESCNATAAKPPAKNQ